MKVTDTQLVIAVHRLAAGRSCSRAAGGAAHKAIGKLLEDGLLEETCARVAVPVWCHNNEGPMALYLMKRGLKVIQIAMMASRRSAIRMRAPLTRLCFRI